MKTMAIMIGIQGSGKSTFCKKYLSNYQRVNLDTLHTRNKEKNFIEKCFENNENIVIDNTNSRIEDREKYISRAKMMNYKVIAYFMQSIIKDCIERNNKRTGKELVPTQAIAHTSNILQIPSYYEGFDELYYVKIENNDFVISNWEQ